MTLIINTSRAIHWFMALLMGSVFYAVSSATSMNLTAHEPGEVTAGFYEPAINFVDRPLPDGVADISPFVQCVRNITGQHVVVSLISWGSSAEYALWWYDGDIDSTEIYEGVVPEFAECYDLLDNSTEVSTWAIGLYPTMGHWDIISDIDMFFRLYDEGTPSFYQPELLEPDVLNTTVIATGCVAKRGNDDPPNMLGGHQWLQAGFSLMLYALTSQQGDKYSQKSYACGVCYSVGGKIKKSEQLSNTSTNQVAMMVWPHHQCRSESTDGQNRARGKIVRVDAGKTVNAEMQVGSFWIQCLPEDGWPSVYPGSNAWWTVYWVN